MKVVNKCFVLVLLFMLGMQTAFAVVKSAVPVYAEDKLGIVVTADNPQFTIKLKSNPTTGYAWFLRDYDANLLVPVKHVFEKPTSQLVGAPTYELWTFKVKPAGMVVPQQSVIRFVYARPWASDDQATQLVFRITTQGK